jgi:LPS O-antigen subunit length determinant protein (WzzB/FepE family)
MIWATLWKLKYWIAIAVLSFACLGQLAYTNHLSKKLRVASEQCTAKIQKIEQKHLKALAEKQNAINQVSADYEKAKSEQRIKVETVTREVQKIIDRPVYQQFCFDDDGVSAINSLITNDSSQSNSTLP